MSFTILLLMVLTIRAQEQLVNGVIEKKQVVMVEGVSADKLYVRALEALSDWAGAQGNSKIGIDVQDKDEGLVVYKGRLEMGFHKVNFMAGWEVFADFTIKIKCKDGRAQVSANVPSLTFDWSAKQYPATETVPISAIYPEFNYKPKLRIKKAAIEFAPLTPSTFEKIIALLATKLQQQPEDDF
jgi:hypothetical protein